MKYSYKKELALLEESKVIKDKLMTFSLYFELTKGLKSVVADTYGDEIWREYQKFLTSTFAVVLSGAALTNDKEVAPSEILTRFLALLSMHALSKQEDVSNFIGSMPKEKVEAMTEGLDYVGIIDSKDVEFIKKAKMLVDFRELTNDILLKTNHFELSEQTLDDLMQVAFKQLEAVLNSGKTYSKKTLATRLKVGTKELLIEKLATENIFASIEANDTTKPFIESLTTDERTYWRYATIYGIAGYGQADQIAVMQDVSTLMNKSALEVQMLGLGLFQKIIQYSQNVMSELDDDDFNDMIKRKR